MNNKEKSNLKDARNKLSENIKMNSTEKLNKKSDKNLPWWVELLFVQIGLSDKLLIKILKTKRKTKDFIKNDRKSLIIIFLAIASLTYFYPVIRHAKNKLDCEAIAKNYIIKNKNVFGMNKRELKMLSTNFCYGGQEINQIENLRN